MVKVGTVTSFNLCMRYSWSVRSKAFDIKSKVTTNPATVLLVSDETVIEHFTSLEKAIGRSNMEDSIVLYPGNYSVGSLVFKYFLTVEGNGDVTGE